MQAHGAAQGVGTIPRRSRRLEVLLAIAALVVIVAVTALLARGVLLATSGIGWRTSTSRRARAQPSSTMMQGTCPLAQAPPSSTMTREICSRARAQPSSTTMRGT